MDVIKDFDLLIPDKRIAKLAGREFDVSLISTRLALKQIRFRDKALTMSGEDALNKAVEIVAEICKPKDNSTGFLSKFLNLFKKKVTAKWLMDHASYAQLLEFIDFALKPLYKEDEPEVEKKK
jgi:hypothetical protein